MIRGRSVLTCGSEAAWGKNTERLYQWQKGFVFVLVNELLWGHGLSFALLLRSELLAESTVNL